MKSIFKSLVLAAGLAGTGFGAMAQEQGIDDPSRAATYEALAGKKVAFVPLGMGLDLTEAWASVMKRQADELGYSFEIRDPNWSTDAGAQAVTQLITEHPDVLVLHNPDIQVYSRLIQRAQEAGIYVLQINLKSSALSEGFVGPDWVALGEKVAQLAVDKCSPANGGSGKVSISQLTITAASNIYQMKGVQNILSQHPEITVVSTQGGDTQAELARAATSTVLQQNPDLCGIIGFWDGQDVGNAAAVEQAGLKGKVSIFTSGGGEQTQCDKVADGEYYNYVSYNAAAQGRDLNTMIKYLLQAKPEVGTVKTNLFNMLDVITAEAPRPDACYSLGNVKALAGMQ